MFLLVNLRRVPPGEGFDLALDRRVLDTKWRVNVHCLEGALDLSKTLGKSEVAGAGLPDFSGSNSYID